MRKIIAAINMSLDGFCDHTSLIADDEIHQHYNELMESAGAILYGRVTYQLMESYWPTLVKEPSGNKQMDEFAVLIDNVPKIVFSHRLKSVEWRSARLAVRDLETEVLELKQQPGKDVFVGSRSLIVALLNLRLIDEFQLCVQPIIAGEGLPLLNDIRERISLKLLRTKTLANSGSVIFYYQPAY